MEVAVMTNSLAANDIAAVHGGYAPYRVALLKGGVKLYELQPEGRKSLLSILGSSRSSLHTKAFTVDDHTGFIGSFNFDARSISLNTEMGVLFNEPVLVERMRVLFRSETDPGSSYRVSLSKKGSLR
ncbi:phospholipase D-like domain-containing protein [Sphingomonas psychrolutea]|nr:phospholipase D-like domain-containing protein [Sphingomonas psychrolutea]